MYGSVTPQLAFIGGLGMGELVVIFLIILVVFGAGKLPKIAKDIGSGIREFKKSMSGESEEPKDSNTTASNDKKDSTKS